MSHDPKIYINWNAEEFPVQPVCLVSVQAQTKPTLQPISGDDETHCLATCVGIISKSVPGGRHGARLEAGETAGGFIAAGRVSEDVMLDALMTASDAVAEGGVTDPGEAKTIRDAITHGMKSPLFADIVPEADTIKRLAELSPIEYDRIRKAEADLLGIRSATLDALIKIERNKNDKNHDSPGMFFDDIEPWAEPIHPEKLLDDLVVCILRFIVCDKHTAIAATLWIAMAWFIGVVLVAPLAVITAPEKRCGKTQLLTLLGRLVPRPLSASNISPSALFRCIAAFQPTLLLDEVETFVKESEEIRGLLNSGHSKDTAFVVRSEGDDHTPTVFNTFGAKALSGIGHLPDTLMDRSIILELRRKLPHESVERLRHAEPDLFSTLTAKLARFAVDYRGQMRDARPQAPDQINDRAQDNWEPLLAIADIAGGEWPEKARAAALKLSGVETESRSLGVELLSDIHDIFDLNKVDKISTNGLIEALCKDEERPWATYNRGKLISPRQVSSRLQSYGIFSKTVRVQDGIKKGYERGQFQDAFDRYLLSLDTPILPVKR